MMIEEAKEELSRLDLELIKMVDCGNKASERMSAGRGRKAMRLAIEALENQSKYENALERAADYINDCDDCPVKECAGVTSGANTDECSKKIISAWKRKAGFEVANNENE